MTTDGAATLVLDEHVMGAAAGLKSRGLAVATVKECAALATVDPKVMVAVAAKVAQPWVLVTMDNTIHTEHLGFDWDSYAIAWIVKDKFATGAAAEESKLNVIHHHANRIVEQRPGDHFTYTVKQRFKSPPSVAFRDRP